MTTIKQVGYLGFILGLMGLIVLIVMLLGGEAKAADWSRGWDSADTVGQVAVTALLVADWGQTIWPTHQKTHYWDGKYHSESNPILGRYPSRGRVNTYFAICTIGHAAISYALPKYIKIGDFKIPARNIWQAVWVGIEANQVRHNYSAGVGWRF